jgi:hypothetical protein
MLFSTCFLSCCTLTTMYPILHLNLCYAIMEPGNLIVYHGVQLDLALNRFADHQAIVSHPLAHIRPCAPDGVVHAHFYPR